MKLIILIWIVGICFCVIITACFVILACEIRGKWAWGGEYCMIPIVILVCHTLTNNIRGKLNRDRQSYIGRKRKRSKHIF